MQSHEQIILDTINKYIGKPQTQDPTQFGFIKGNPCLLNLVDFFEKVTKARDEGNMVHTAYLDLAKAFNKIFHSGIVDKLIKLDINPYKTCWIAC